MVLLGRLLGSVSFLLFVVVFVAVLVLFTIDVETFNQSLNVLKAIGF